MKRIKWVAMLAGVALAAACGGGSGGGATGATATPGSGALSVAEKVSVVDAQAATEASIVRGLKADFAKAADALPDTSPYATDTTNTYVEERSADSFARINEILCSMAQTQYDAMLNQGDYKAQVDASQCGQTSDDASAAGTASQNQSTGSNATQYEDWTVNSSRVTDQPHIVKVWFHQDAENSFDVAKDFFVKATIYEGVSASNPIGIFVADFKSCLSTDTSCASPMMQGYLRSERDGSDNVLLKFFVDGGFSTGGAGGDMTFTERVTLNKGPSDSGSGSSNVASSNDFEGASEEAFNVAYNADYFYRAAADGSGAVCLDRSNFSTNVWRYGVYHDENHATPGERVSRGEPGFPIQFGDFYGFAGYYGVWLPSEANLASGDIVYKQDFSSEGPPTETPYTVFIAGGRLQKHVRQTVTLGDIVDVPLSWNKCEDQGGGEWSCVDNRVKWTGTQLIMDAVRSQSTGWMWQNLDVEVVVTFGETDFSFNFWSESLGGEGRIPLMDPETGFQLTAAQLTDATVVIFNKVSTVYPGEVVPATLACFEDCIDPSAIDTESPYFENSTYMGGMSSFNVADMGVAPGSLVDNTNYITYTFNSVTMLLEQGGSPVVSAASGNGVWGGALVDPANFAELGCDWAEATQTCTWKVWDLSVFYTWETGDNEWNRLTALQDADNQFVAFDPPLMLKYVRPTNSAQYYLEYNGFGDLWGIPGKCVDADTGLDTECWSEDDQSSRHIRWIPEFSIPAASTVTDVTSSPNLTYYVKPLDQEQQMISTDVANCTGAGLALTAYALPDESLVADPDIGAEPAVDNAPAVIGGVLQ